MDRLLSTRDVLSITGYRSRTTLWRKVRDRLFPAPVKLNGVTLRWREAEIREWIADSPVQSYPTSPLR
jgi:prophage regulatory protein